MKKKKKKVFFAFLVPEANNNYMSLSFQDFFLQPTIYLAFHVNMQY
jgi:hypothetical protein